MTTVSVVPTLDELEDGHTGLGLGAPHTSVDEPTLQRREETFGQCAIVAIAHRTHRGMHPHLLASLAKGNRGVLGTLVGMVNHFFGPSLAQRHVQRIEHQRGPQMISHRPSHHPAAVRIEYHREEHEARPGAR